MNTPNFPENCMKSKEFGRPGGGRASLTSPLDPPMRSIHGDHRDCYQLHINSKSSLQSSFRFILRDMHGLKILTVSSGSKRIAVYHVHDTLFLKKGIK